MAQTDSRDNAGRWGLFALSLSMVLSSLGSSSANVGLPVMAQAFAVSFSQVQWIVVAYLLTTTTLVVGAGRLGDLIGRRRLLLVGISVYTMASALCSLAPTFWLLVAARVAQAVGAAAMMALTMALVSETVPKDRIGRAMGVLGTMSAIGTALGPSLGGLLIAGLGWPAIFLANVPLGIATLLLASRHLPKDCRAARGERTGFDLAGTLSLAVTLAAYALAMTMDRGHFGALTLGLLAVALMGACLFVRVEQRVKAPLMRLEMLADPGLSSGLAAGAVVSAVVMTTLVIGPFYLARGLGLGPASVGVVLSLGPLVAALSGLPAGHLVDRLGAGRVAVLGLVAMAAAACAMAVLPAWSGVPGYVVPVLVLTAGYALFQAANNTAIMRDVPPDRRGGVSALLTLSRNLGLITGASAMGAIFAHGVAADLTAASSDAVATGMRVTFAVAAILLIAALGLTMGSRVRAPSRERLS